MIQGLFRKLGVMLHYGNRAAAILTARYFRWTLQSYLQSHAKSCGSVDVVGFCRFAGVRGLSLGRNIHINVGAYWVCDGGVTIGDNCHFGKNSTIYSRNHDYHGKALPYDDTNIARPVVIHRNVWVGANVTILPGAEIGEGAIIGAGAVVHGKVPDYSIYGAASPQKIGQRDLEHYRKTDAAGHYGGPSGKLVIDQGGGSED